ncbi:MAG: helix-turn-helix domain-containing protein [Clostridia bacterium]|nr:helix-turn-helix domain-containing protein [Clostridia bacterium]
MIVPQNKTGNFLMLSNSIFKQGLKPREFIVYCCLVKHSDKNGVCFPSRRLIAEECCVDKKTVDAAILNLEKTGLVKKKKRRRQDGSNTSNVYTVKLFR